MRTRGTGAREPNRPHRQGEFSPVGVVAALGGAAAALAMVIGLALPNAIVRDTSPQPGLGPGNIETARSGEAVSAETEGVGGSGGGQPAGESRPEASEASSEASPEASNAAQQRSSQLDTSTPIRAPRQMPAMPAPGPMPGIGGSGAELEPRPPPREAANSREETLKRQVAELEKELTRLRDESERSARERQANAAELSRLETQLTESEQSRVARAYGYQQLEEEVRRLEIVASTGRIRETDFASAEQLAIELQEEAMRFGAIGEVRLSHAIAEQLASARANLGQSNIFQARLIMLGAAAGARQARRLAEAGSGMPDTQ